MGRSLRGSGKCSELGHYGFLPDRSIALRPRFRLHIYSRRALGSH